jgi:hypothetical protein
MITQIDFNKNFAPFETPTELIALLDFANEAEGWYSGRFSLQANGDKSMLASYSEENEFLDALKLIAQTSSSGTLIFIWIVDKAKSLSEQPIVIFGDEGGYDVLFENVKDLLHYLSFNAAIYSANELSFVENPGYENPSFDKYLIWLKQKYNQELITADEADELGMKAQKKYGILFADWMKKFVNP